jgi:hypothetical protein
MAIKKLLPITTAGFLVFMMVTGSGAVYGQAKDQTVQAGVHVKAKVMIKGKIGQMNKAPKEEMSGYVVFGQQPSARYHIVNPNPGVLDKLMKKGNTSVIEGHTTSQGVEFLFIEKIDGRKYTGKNGPSGKPVKQ